MPQPHAGADGERNFVYGFLVLVVTLVCLIFLARQGTDVGTAATAITAIIAAAGGLIHRVLRRPPDEDDPDHGHSPGAESF